MLTAIRQWVIKTMLKSKGQTGVVQTLPKKDLVELNVQITAQRLMKNGIEPNSLKNADQVENAVNAIESRSAVQQGIKSTPEAKVFDLEGRQIKNTDNIMGGEELPPPGSRGGDDDIAAPFASREETMSNMVKDELMKTENPFSDLVKTTEKGPKSLKQREKEILESMEKNNKEAVERIRERKRLEDLEDPEDMATGGRVGLAAGKFVKLAQLLKNEKKVKQAIDNIFPTGDVKYDATMAAESLVELNPKIFANKLYDDLDSRTRLDIYDAVISPMMADQAKALRMKRASKPTKTLEGIEKTGKINISDPEVAEEFARFMRETSPSDAKKLEQTLELDAFDPKGRKKNATGGRAGFRSGSGKGIMEFFKNMIKPRKPKAFDEIRFREGPIDLKFLENLQKKDLEKFIRTRDTKGIGGYGMYENFADMPAGLRAAELISTIKGPANKINYKAAELFLGKKLRGDETVDELLQVLNRQEMRAEGGRIGYKDGPDMGRRTFLKILGGLAAVPIIGKFIKPMKVGKKIAKVPIIKTDNVAGKPEWFDALVNKVIIEGDDVTKKFATGERQSIHQKTLDDGSVVRVTEDVDDGAVRVEYESETNTFGDTASMEYKKPLPDEGDPNPGAEFTTAESGPVGRQTGPDDFDIDVDEVGGTSIKDLDSDVSKLKEYATGKKPTIKEILQNKKRRDKASAITNDIDGAASDAVIRRQGDYDPSDYDDYASGGIARMLGE